MATTGRTLLQELDLRAGKAKVYRLKGRDVRDFIRMAQKEKDSVLLDVQEAAALKATTLDDKPLTMDTLDELDSDEYMTLLRAQEGNFTPTTAPAT